MRLPLFPVKGHHYPGESYVEFEGDISCITEDTIGELRMAMQIDMQANLKVQALFTTPGTAIFESALLPQNFKPPVNKPLRLTQIEGYRWLPCGGTHVEALRDIKSVLPVDFYKKGGKVRLSYRCEMWETVAV
jgi:Ser-tRNA(Ala) deacylase AlaX